MPKMAEELSRKHDILENDNFYQQNFPNGISGVGPMENLSKVIFDKKDVNGKFQENIMQMEGIFGRIKSNLDITK